VVVKLCVQHCHGKWTNGFVLTYDRGPVWVAGNLNFAPQPSHLWTDLEFAIRELLLMESF